MRTSLHKEFWVGLLVLLVVVLLVVFGWLMGVVGPFQKMVHYQLLYGFAGGVEVGSPVRVSGVKVGKVAKIEFLSPEQAKDANGATLKLTIDVTERAATAVREDSNFFVNMAGIIGERYVEVSPGSITAALLPAGATVRGIDPPRIDQLLSQGYGVFGKVEEFMEKNQKNVQEFLEQMSLLMTDANKMLKGKEKQKLFQLLDKLYDVASDVHAFTSRMKEPRTQKAIDDLFEIIDKGQQIDKAALKKFLQEEGVRARIF
jgi:phospholipid/cholesterol/gamma-HCH transport system substrate-binding protein